jgi:hypothetical protein
MYAIYRVEKHKTAGTIAASSGHMMRSRPTPNADPKRTGSNVVIVGSDDPARDVSQLLPESGERGDDGKLRRAKNSVLTLEVLLTASPEWWAEATPEQQSAWVDQSCEWLRDEYGTENIAHLQLHQDERTPHLTGMIVPLDPSTGRLNARRWTGGREALRKQQTNYAAAVENLGLSRGIEGSAAKHERVARHYAQLNQPIKPIRIEAPKLRDLFRPAEYVKRQKRAATAQVGPVVARARTAETARNSEKRAKATADKARRKSSSLARDLQAEKQGRKTQADQMRALALTDVADALGYVRDKTDPKKWSHPATSSNISINGSKFFDHNADTGGGGAIDLAKHAMETDFQGALSWLSASFGSGAAAADLAAVRIAQAKRDVSQAAKERDPFEPPWQSEPNWPHVRAWLIEERGLPADEVDRLHDKGDVYADDRRNAVFISRDASGKAVGAELKGTSPGSKFAGLAPGSMKSVGGFRLGKLSAKALYIVESAIDAISLYVLRRRAGEKSLCVVSAAGSSPIAPAIAGVSAADRKICAYDADDPGDKAAGKLGWDRLRPTAGKDWNDQIRAADEQPPAARTDPRSPGPAGPKI